MNYFLLAFTLFFSTSVFAKTAPREPASLGCDHAQVENYIKTKTAHYNQEVKEGRLSVQEGQSLVEGLTALIEMNAVNCGWAKPEPVVKADICTETRQKTARWASQKARGALSQAEYNALVTSQKSFVESSGRNCN